MLGHTAEAEAGLSDSDMTPRSLREVEAEAVALVCLEALGLPGAEHCRGYIQHWNERRGAEPIPERSAQRIFKAADQILKAGTREDRRPALDQLITDAKRRRFDVLVCWRLDRLGRNLKHLITLLEELQALGVAFVSLAEGIDATTPAGKLADAHPRGDCGVRAGTHPRTRAGGPTAGQDARAAARQPKEPGRITPFLGATEFPWNHRSPPRGFPTHKRKGRVGGLKNPQ